jgi:hypothetical protein
LPNLLFQNFWIGLAVWVLLYISDYTFTIVCARLYQGGVRNKIAFEGSYEINPYFQRDIDSLRIVSPRFILVLVVTSLVLFVFWRLTPPSAPSMYLFMLGMLIGPQLLVHTRHLRNLFLFRAAATDAVRGRIEYSREVGLRGSSVELLSFAAIFVVLFAFTESWFTVGGAISCLSIAIKHWRLAAKHVAAVPTGQGNAASAGMC